MIAYVDLSAFNWQLHRHIKQVPVSRYPIPILLRPIKFERVD